MEWLWVVENGGAVGDVVKEEEKEEKRKKDSGMDVLFSGGSIISYISGQRAPMLSFKGREIELPP